MLFEDTVADALDGGLTGVGVADDATFADVGAAGLELRLDENDGFALPGVVRRAERARTAGRTRVAEMKETSMAKKQAVVLPRE